VQITAPPAAPAEPARAPSAVVAPARDFDVAALLDVERPVQGMTSPVTQMTLPTALKVRWRRQVGRTTFRSTMALVNGALVIGTHGATLDRKAERSDGVYVLDARTGAVRTQIRPPGGGDLDVGGVAVDGDRVFFGTDSGLIVAAKLTGGIEWTAHSTGKVRPAPALADLDGDGSADVVVGDEGGVLHAIDGRSGHELWRAATAVNEYGARGFIAAAAIADLDGDGHDDVVAGARDGILVAYRGLDGAVLWQVAHDSGMHASPSVADFDGDGRPEILAAWSYGTLGIYDGKTGARRWETTLAQDGGGIEGLFGSPVPLAGAPGVLVSPTAWWGDEDGVILVGAEARAFRAHEGRVSATPVVTDLDEDGTLEAIVGTEKGALVAYRATGGRALLATLGGPIEASPLLADVDGDGAAELLVASNDGVLTCFQTGSRAKPDLARFRGADARNRGELGRVSLGWHAPLSGQAGPVSAGIRVDYLVCCTELERAATLAPAPDDQALLRAAALCLTLAAGRTDRAAALTQIRSALPTVSALPGACR
jgi:hypothetical protein